SPKLLLLDEHTASLDPKTSNVVMKKTKDLINNKNITTIMITHNMKDAVEYTDRVIMLKEGEIFMDEKSKNISERDLNDLYKLTI
ncbi:MAG: ABC transporter ATP-binding protein, partial [Tissierellia bacterium]|nr:ABC transporter ATP-binding protein [Tissierellia bacterium]